MAIFDKFKKMNIGHRKNDEAIYSIIAQEMEDGFKNNGLWLKALEQADGNKEKQVAEYIKLRVRSLKDNVSIFSESFEEERRISHSYDIEEFVNLLGDGSPVEKMQSYTYGMSHKKIHEFINQPDACENYPIHIAIKNERVDLAEWLIRSGANPQVKNYWGNTALEIAEKNEDDDAINLLLQFTA